MSFEIDREHEDLRARVVSFVDRHVQSVGDESAQAETEAPAVEPAA